MTRLASLLDRYGEAIAADLAFTGWDVVDLWERGRWSWALNLIDHLPRTSAYRQAVAEDEEVAVLLLDEPLPKPSVPLTEWSAEVEALAVVADRLWDVCNTIASSVGGKPGPVKRYPRPVTALEIARARRREQDATRLESKLWPTS